VQVRSLCITAEGAVVTGSRDKTIKLWTEQEDGSFADSTTLVRWAEPLVWSGSSDGSGGGWQRLCLLAQRRCSCPPRQVGHTDFVSALAYAPPGVLEGCPGGAIVSGSRDTTVLVWDPQTAEVVQRLEGHQYQVGGRGARRSTADSADSRAAERFGGGALGATSKAPAATRTRGFLYEGLLRRRPPSMQVTAVLVTPDGDIVSASLDKTLRVWRGGRCVAVLEGHEAAVLCALALPSGDILSGSGDCTIRVWSDHKCTHTIAAHSDSVRGLALLPGIGVVSASHDQSLKVWTLAGECVAELVGHTALVYCAAATADGLVASGSEDCSARLWHADGTCLQVRAACCCWLRPRRRRGAGLSVGKAIRQGKSMAVLEGCARENGGAPGRRRQPRFPAGLLPLLCPPASPLFCIELGMNGFSSLPPPADPGAPQQPVGGGLPAQRRPCHSLLRPRGACVDPGRAAEGPR
jgi:phospholipase A-2-activating protein